MAIFINDLEENYVKIPNALIVDKRMNAREFRLYCYVRSRKGTWKINNRDIMKKLSIKTEQTLSNYWKTLIKCKLIERMENRREAGKFGGFDLRLLPYQEPEKSPTTNEPRSVEPRSVGSIPDSIHTGTIQGLNKTDKKNKTDSINKTDKEKVSQKRNFKKPSVEEIEEYCIFRENNVDPEGFWDFYESKDWKIGKNKMKDWKAAVRTWERKNKKESSAKEKRYGRQTESEIRNNLDISKWQ